MRIRTILLSALLLAPLSLAAQTMSAANKTGLPEYPHLKDGGQIDQPQVDEDTGRPYLMYTAGSDDPLPVIEAWYKKALPKATEKSLETFLLHGFEFTVGNDKVRVYHAGTGRNSIVALWKYVATN
ncbi:MAG: hypothetical protein ACREP9_07325 [Candidatus Dormibacteraceae bacterium]